MNRILKYTLCLLMLIPLPEFAFGQGIDLLMTGSKTCANYTYCVTIGMQSSAGNGNVEIGNTSLYLTYDEDVIDFKNYTSFNFDGSGLCNNGSSAAWASHAYDAVSLPGKFNLSLLLTDNNYSCPTITESTPVTVGSVCFDILKQGLSPEITFDSLNCHINSDSPNNGTSQILIASIDSIFTSGILACDCSAPGDPCNDQNVYTINDQYDSDCNCVGILADVDQDGIYDGIDPCFDVMYQSENAHFSGGPVIKDNQGQFTGSGFLDFTYGTGQEVEFSIMIDSTGDHELGFRYALDKNNPATMELEIDGAVINSSLAFPLTTSWTDWDTILITRNFSPGAHTVKLSNNSGHGINLDGLRVSFCTTCTMSGQPCNDANICTVGDVYDSNCNCAGVYMDSDEDTVCDVSDICPGFDDLADTDSDGTPDGCDNCDNSLIGTSCDDGDPCTIGDVYDSNCNCAGTFTGTDSDGDGVCDAYDICSGGDDNIDTDMDGIPDFCDSCNDLTIGMPCNDSDTCTILDVITPTCGCAGIYIDTDGDGVCNILDICEGFDDNIDTDMDGIPDGCDNCDNALIGTPCDDGDHCTINDVYDTNCNCVGVFEDTDNDGTCDAEDLCPMFNDSIDSDLDVIPDLCDTCYDFTYQEAQAYYSGVKLKTWWKGYSGDGYFDFQTQNTDTIIYTIQVDVPGTYDVSLRYASWSNHRKVDVEIDGVLEISDLAFPNTNSWEVWDKVVFTKTFTTGTHEIKLTTNGSSGPNIDLLSICLPGYIPEAEIAEGNNEFEQNFNNWTRESNWGAGNTKISVNNIEENVVCGNKSALSKVATVYEQLYTDIRYLIIDDTMTLHFYSKGGAADVYVGSPHDIYSGNYLYKDISPIEGEFVHDSIEFIVTEPVMRIWLDIYPGDSLYLDAFSFDNTNCQIKLKPTVFLEGNYDTSSGLMNDDLRTDGILPLAEPYTGLGFQQFGRGGGETVDSTVFDVSGNDAIVDWVFIELRDKSDSTIVLHTKSALLQRDGDLVELDGNSPVTFRGIYEDEFWVSINHRNHLGVMTAAKLGLSSEIEVLDFSSIPTFGNIPQKDEGGGVKSFWSGDINFDGLINNIDRNLEWNNRNGEFYHESDCTLDGKIDASDRVRIWNNKGKTEQIPQ